MEPRHKGGNDVLTRTFSVLIGNRYKTHLTTEVSKQLLLTRSSEVVTKNTEAKTYNAQYENLVTSTE